MNPRYALILVRVGSTRLPEKCLLPFGKGNVLEHVCRRTEHFGFTPIICTTSDHTDNPIAGLGEQNGWQTFRGDIEDKIRRLRDACDQYGVQKFITIDADDPFFDGDANMGSLERLINSNLDMIKPPKEYYCGSMGFSLSYEILDRAVKERDTSNSEMMWTLIESLNGVKHETFLAPITGMTKIRLTLDYIEDYHILCFILRELGPYVAPEHIKKFFNQNPDLFKLNWFRQDDWAERQAVSIASYAPQLTSN